MIKESASAKAMLLKALLGGTLGGLHGYYVSPTVLDYKDNKAARNFSTLIDAGMGAVLGAGMHRGSLATLKPQQLAKGVSAYAVGQTLPVLQATLADQRDAIRANADAAKVTSIPYNLQRALKSNIGIGALEGVGAAGLAGLVTGALRRRTENEERKARSRGSMMMHDTLKYLLPAMALGGVVGSFRHNQQPNTAEV